MAISNLLQPNKTVPNLINSLAPSKPLMSPLSIGGQTTPKTISSPTAPTATQKDYSTFTDADWLAYQANKKKPLVSAPKTTTSSTASYRGVPLSGTDAQIQEQMRRIDNPTTIGSYNPPTMVGTATPTQQTQPKGLFADVTSSLANRGTYRDPAYEAGLAKYNKLAEDIANVGIQGAKAQAGYQTTGTTPVAEGNAAVIARTTAAQQAALGTQQQAALTSAGQGLQQQQIQQNALGTVAGLAPEAMRFEAFGGQGGSLSPQTRAQELAQQVRSGLISPQAAESQMSSLYGGAGATFLNQALQGTGYNYIAGGAQAASQAANIQQQQTAGVDIARQGLADATQTYVSMTGASQFAGQQAEAVNNILEKTGLNNVSSTDYNKALNTLKSRFSDTDFASLNTALREAQIAYTSLLATAGGTPTGNEEQALATLNINQSASVIKASIAQLENAVARRLQAQYGVMNQYQQNLGSTGGTTTSSGSTGGSVTWDSI